MNEGQTQGRLRGPADLEAIKRAVNRDLALREDGFRCRVTVHLGTCGIASGARDVLEAMLGELEACGREDVRVTTSGCIGACSHEPVMTVEVLGSESVLYGGLDAHAACEIFRDHVLGGRPVLRYTVGRDG